MFDNNSQWPISFNWPLAICYIFSLVIHWAILTNWSPAKPDSIPRMQFQVNLASDPTSQLHAEAEKTPNSIEDTLSSKKKAFNAPSETENNKTESIEPIYFPTRLMERHPFPVSAPTPKNYLDKNTLPAEIIRLRLFISAAGKIVNIKIHHPENIEESVSRQILNMFYATSFIPGNIRGIDLPCYMDIELDLGSYIE